MVPVIKSCSHAIYLPDVWMSGVECGGLPHVHLDSILAAGKAVPTADSVRNVSIHRKIRMENRV